MAGSVGGGDASATSAQCEGMSEIASFSENRSPAATSISIGASNGGSELAGSQVVESSAEPEGVVSSKNRCSELLLKFSYHMAFLSEMVLELRTIR
jgi:hypothetical protein